MSRREGAGTYRRGAWRTYAPAWVAAFSTLLTLAAGRPVFTEREYTVVAGTVVDIFDLSDATRTHVLTQADPAKQVLPPAPHADFWRPCYDFSAGTAHYVSNATAASWNFMHNGAGGGVAMPLSLADTTGTQYLIATRNSTRGCACVKNPTNWVGLAYNGAASLVVTAVANTAPAAGAKLYSYDYTEGASPEYRIKVTGLAESTGSSALAPDAANAQFALTWGALSGGTSQMKLRTPGVFFAGTHTASQRAQRDAALQALYGVAA